MNFPLCHFPSDGCRRLLLLAGMVVTLLLFAACGKKGPLYLPDDAASASGKTGGQVTTPAPAQPPK